MSNRDTSQDLLHQALQAEHHGRFEEAMHCLRQVVQHGDPAMMLEARLRLGRLLLFGREAEQQEASGLLREARAEAERTGGVRQSARAIHLLALLERYRRN